MALRPILRFPDPRLREKSNDVVEFGDELRALVADMVETMFEANGAGLAAIQVGAPLRLFVIDGGVAGDGEAAPPRVFINPEIVELSEESQTGDEGCLSFPGIFVPIKRSLRARVRATGLDGKEFVAEGEGLYARAMQHENDHLINKLLIDYVGPLKRQMIKRKMEKMSEEEAAELQAAGE